MNILENIDCMSGIKKLPNKSVDSVITSPPYYQLRDYGFDGQWGLEKTYQEYLDHLISLMAEIKRVLKDEGTIWINLGDSFSGSGQDSGKQDRETSQDIWGRKVGVAPLKGNYPKDIPSKSLICIPHRFAIRCVDELGLILRNDIIWAKPNGMPESVTDRFSKKHEFIFFFVKQQKYYFDLDAIRSELKNQVMIRNKASEEYGRGSGSKQFSEGSRIWGDEEKGKNPGDVSDFWDITTKPNKSKHYATFNSELIDKPIIAGCPKDGIILDPFAGTATTLLRAAQLDRQYIGFEGSKEYHEIGQKRLNEFHSQIKMAI